jgi:hypothetical protein
VFVAGLYHDFLLLSSADDPITSYEKFVNNPGAILLHDDLIGYMWDSLLWVPSYNPAKGEPSVGLFRWGPTVIRTDGATTACRVFTAWADLFSAGPRSVRLTGNWTCVEGAPINEGTYDRLEFDRDETVDRLRRLARWADKVGGSGSAL